jgi:hypothetical protein
VKPRDFKSLVSTNFTTRAYKHSLHLRLAGQQLYSYHPWYSPFSLLQTRAGTKSVPFKFVPNEFVWRLRPESNRRTRLCRPLHNHSATQPQNRFFQFKLIKKGGGDLPSPPPLILKPTDLFSSINDLNSGAGNEIRTRDPNLGKVVLYH